MFVYKKLKPSDVSITPFEAHKQYIYGSSSAGSNGITFNTALWTSESKAHYSANNLAGNFQNHRNYFQFDKVFYRDYILDNANLIPDVNYIKQERRLYDKVNILSIPQGLFGNRIQPTTFNLTGSFNSGNTIIEINDDGEGNIYPTTHILGESNWPSEKKRVVYIGPVKGFKKKDLNVLPGTGNILVNRVTSFTQENVYDDSYYINQVDYNKVTFNGDTPLTYIDTGTDGHLRLDHDNKYNFGHGEDFNISFYFKPDSDTTTAVDRSPTNNEYYIIAKSDTKTIVPTPGEGQSEILSTFASGNLQTIDVPAENRYPFKIYYKHDLEDTGSIFFERSNGSLTSFVSTSLFYTDSTNDNIHVSAQKSGSELQLWINGVKMVSGSDINPVVCKDQPPTNEANLYVGTRGNIDSYLNSNLSQIMIWNEALSETQIQNVSESITGTPYIGNIFYDEGFITINHPSYSDVLQQYSGSISETITLNPTYGDEYNYDISVLAFSNPTFTASLNFYNEDAMFWLNPTTYAFINSTTVYRPPLSGYWHEFSPGLETDLGSVIIGPVNEEVLRLDFMTASNFDIANSDQQPFTPSGSNNSIISPTINNNAPYAFLSSSRAETTESINILFASNSQEIINDTFTGTADSTIADTLFTFGVNPSSIGGNSYSNFGGVYEDSNVDGIHIIAERENTEDYFLGSLLKIFYQTSGVGDEDYNKATFDSSTQIVPFGIDSGSEFRISPNHDIKILTTPPNSVSQPLKFEITGSITNLELDEYIGGGPGSSELPAKLYVDLRINNSSVPTLSGGDVLYDSNFYGGEFKAEWISHTGDPAQNLDINPDDVFTVWVKITDWDSSGNTYNYKVTKFKITQPDPGNVFDNNLVLTSSFDTKLSASYTIELNNIDPTAATDVDSRFLGLHQDGNDNDLGVRINVYRRNINPLYPSYGSQYTNYSLLTSSFYNSGSTYASNNFSYTYITDPDDVENLLIYAVATNADTTGSIEVGISQSFSLRGPYTVLEKSGSNKLHLDTSLGVNFQNSDYEPIITFGSNSGSIYGSNPVSISSISSDIVTVADEYLITGSISATASYFVKQKISASTELEIVTSSLLTIENFYLGSGSDNFYSSSLTTNNGVPRVRIYSGSDLVNTSVGSVDGTGYLIIENQHLGYFASGSTLGIHLDVVDSTSPSTPITSSEGEGYSIDNLQITGISSSITLSLSASSTNFDPEITHIQFTSPHSNVGSTELPFTTGDITASVSYVNENTVTLGPSEALLFTSESLGTIKMIASSSEGFPITVTWTFEGGGSGSLYKFYTGSNLYTNVLDLIKTDGEIDANEGLTLFIKDPEGNVLTTSSFIDSASATTELLTLRDTHFTSSQDGTFIVELKTTDSQSNEIPVTWDLAIANLVNYSAWSKGASITGPVLTELSGSDVSNQFQNSIASLQGATFNEDMFKIVSSHINTGSFSNSPFTIGTNEIQGSISNNGITENITLNTPLFITASTAVTGGYAQTQYFLTQESQSAVSLPSPLSEGNFTIGNNTYNIESVDGTNFIIDEPLLLTEDTNVTLNYHTTASNDFTVKFKNSHLIFEHEYQCSVDEEEYNYTTNISVRKNKSNKSADLADCLTGSIDNSQITLFKPYTTTVGLYDDHYNLLAVGKFAQPVRMSEETDMTFVIRWDS